MPSLVAVTRAVPGTLDRCQLTFKERETIDVPLAREQHRGYEQALESLGVRVQTLPARDELPDSVFVEDAAVVFDEVAVITTPGTPTRAAEGEAIAETLERYRPLRRVLPPGTLDGGDVLCIGRAVYVGRSTRSNDEGIARFRELLAPFGYTVTAVPLRNALHLKTACTYAGRGVLLANPEWVDTCLFARVTILAVPEPWGASVLDVGGKLVMPASYPRTRELLEKKGFETLAVDLSELQKAEGGPTCLSLLFATW